MLENRQEKQDYRRFTCEALMFDIEDSYNPTMILAHERSVNMIDNDKKAQTVFLELEYMIENVVM